MDKGNVLYNYDNFKSGHVEFNVDVSGRILDCVRISTWENVTDYIYIDIDGSVYISEEKKPSFENDDNLKNIKFIVKPKWFFLEKSFQYSTDSIGNIKKYYLEIQNKIIIDFYIAKKYCRNLFPNVTPEQWEYPHTVENFAQFINKNTVQIKGNNISFNHATSFFHNVEMNCESYWGELDNRDEIWDTKNNQNTNREYIWLSYFGRIPSSAIYNINFNNIKLLKKYKKYFNIVNNLCVSIGSGDTHEVDACFKIIELVNGDKNLFNSLMSNYDSYEQAIFFLSDIAIDRLKYVKKSGKNQEYIASLKCIPENIKLSKKMTMSEIIAIGKEFRTKYTNVENFDIAIVCQDLNMADKEYQAYENWLKNCNVNTTYESIPRNLIYSENGYIGQFLQRDDYRGPLLGVITHCCQHPNGAAKTCAQYGWKNPNGGFFVVEKNGQIIAQSFVWVKNNVMYFDNIEGYKINDANSTDIANIYKKFAEQIIGKFCIKRCVTGIGYTKISPDFFPEKTNDYMIAKDQNTFYSDAKYDTRLLAGKNE